VFAAGNEPVGGKYMQAEAVLPELTEIEERRGGIGEWRQSRPKSRAMLQKLWQGELRRRMISNGSVRHRGGVRRLR
jgi:hypothetical protein